MFDITVSGSGGTSPTDPSGTLPLTTPSTTSGPLDTIDFSTDTNLGNVGLTPAGGISLKAYQGLMLSTSNDFQDMLQQISADSATRTSRIYQNALVTVQSLTALISQLKEISIEEQTLYTQEQTDTGNYNTSVGTYNSATGTNTADQAQITTMNNAIVAWQNANSTYNSTVATLNTELAAHTITQAQYDTQLAAANSTLSSAQTTYNNAVIAYSTYNSGRSTSNASALADLNTAAATYKSQVDNVENPQIAAINAKLIKAGLSPLPSNSDTTPGAPTIPALPTPPAATPVPPTGTQISYTNPSPASTLPAPTPPPSLTTSINQAMAQLAVANTAVTTLANILDVYNNYNDYIRYNLQGGKITVNPNNFKERAQSMNHDASEQVGTGAGVSAGLLSTTLPNPLATRNLSTAINNENYSNIINIPPTTGALAQFLLQELLTQSSLSAGTSAAQILASQLAATDVNSPLAGLAIALAFATQNSALVSSDQLKESVLALLAATNPGANAEQLAQVGNGISAQLKLSLLQSSLLAQAKALNFPELSAALIGQINTPGAAAALQSSSTSTLNDVFTDILSKSAISDNLVANANGQVSPLQAQNVVNDVANQVQQGTITNQDELNSSIRNSLIQQGILQNNAGALADQSSSYIEAEVNGSLSLNASIQSAQLSQQNLASQLQQQGIAASIANQTASSALASTDLHTQRDLRDSLAKQLAVAQGKTQADIATYLAANTAIEAQTAKDTERAQERTEEQLRAAIADHAIAQGATQDIANQVVASVLGYEQRSPTSLLNQVQDQIAALKTASAAQGAQAEQTAFHSLLRPTFDAFVQNNRDLDPAKLVYNNFQTSIQMGPLQMPSNYKKELDFWV